MTKHIIKIIFSTFIFCFSIFSAPTTHVLMQFDANSLEPEYQVFARNYESVYEATICNESDVPIYLSTNGHIDEIRVGAGMTIHLRGTIYTESHILCSDYIFIRGDKKGTGMIFMNCSS